ncbi:DUF2169 domain-containing protein [Microvirga sp. 0TCS3.31]
MVQRMIGLRSWHPAISVETTYSLIFVDEGHVNNEECEMWAVENRTPYAVGRTWGRNKDGVHEWIVAIKGTFNIRPDGSLTLADEQLDPLLVPEYNGEDFVSSLRYDADLVGPKPTTDVVLNGTAYAPQGRPASEFAVSLHIGDVHKALRVLGNRWWEWRASTFHPSAVQPVASVPIIYERAYGGFDQSSPNPKEQRLDTRNPVGCGMVPKDEQPLPNLEYIGGRLESTGPAGFGALDCYWSPRRELSGTYDAAWQQSRYPLLPADWDPRSLLCSPADQRPDRPLRGGELVVLENLTPNGKLSFELPKIFPRFTTYIDNSIEEHQGQLASVIIEPDYPRILLIWQSTLLVRTNGDYLDKTIVREKARLR